MIAKEIGDIKKKHPDFCKILSTSQINAHTNADPA